MNYRTGGPEEPETIPRLRPIDYSWAIPEI